MASEAEPLRGLWYMPALSSSLKPGQMRREMLLGEPVLLGRMRDGAGLCHARHLSPSRRAAVGGKNPAPRTLSNAPIMAGASAATASAARFPRWWRARISTPDKIRVRHYPVREQDGLIWVYVAAKNEAPEHRAAARSRPECDPPLERNPDFSLRHRPCRDRADGPGAWSLCACSLVVEPYAAGEGEALRAAAQRLCDDGAQAVQAGYSLLGDVTTEITFELPSTRFEIITGTLLGTRFHRCRPYRLHPAR